MESDAKPLVRVGTSVLIRDQQGRILLGLRKSPHGTGTWCMPGGAVDFGESPVGAARREAKEETGLELGALHVASTSYVNTHFDVVLD